MKCAFICLCEHRFALSLKVDITTKLLTSHASVNAGASQASRQQLDEQPQPSNVQQDQLHHQPQSPEGSQSSEGPQPQRQQPEQPCSRPSEDAWSFVAETLSRLCRRGHASYVAQALWQAGLHQAFCPAFNADSSESELSHQPMPPSSDQPSVASQQGMDAAETAAGSDPASQSSGQYSARKVAGAPALPSPAAAALSTDAARYVDISRLLGAMQDQAAMEKLLVQLLLLAAGPTSSMMREQPSARACAAAPKTELHSEHGTASAGAATSTDEPGADSGGLVTPGCTRLRRMLLDSHVLQRPGIRYLLPMRIPVSQYIYDG